MSQQEIEDRPTLLDPDGSIAREARQKAEKARELWAEQCPGVDTLLDEYASRVGGEVHNYVEHTASRSLTWSQDGVDHSVLMLLNAEGQNPGLEFFKHAHLDNEATLERLDTIANVRCVPIPTPEEAVRWALDTTVSLASLQNRVIRAAVEGRRVHRAEAQVVRSPLPPPAI